LSGITGDVDVALQSFDRMSGDHEPIAVAVHVEAAHHVLTAQTSEDEMARFYFDQIAVLGQTVQYGI
jgi:hypothetical protein